MWKINYESGFTLVEIVVALAVLMILLVPFTFLFTSSFTNIFAAGNKNQALYDVQKELENEINSSSAVGIDILQIDFPTVIQSIRVGGKIITIEKEYSRGTNKENVELKAFVPLP